MTLLFYTKLEYLVKQKLRTPFINPEDQKLIVHCCYHKVGTAWFIRVLRRIARYYGLNFQRCEQSELKEDSDIFMEYMSRVDVKKLPTYIGSHMIRDPRDIVISGYFYHMWTKEEWAHIPRENLDNMTYQEYLQSLNQEEGLLAEMKGTSKEVIEEMSNWDYSNPNFFEFKYEDIIHHEKEVFYQIFKHYEFSEEAIQNCLSMSEKFSFNNKAKRKVGTIKSNSHLRSGRCGEWRDFFNENHKQQFKELFGDVLIKLGYETNNNW